jgi:hypothetical protein
MRTYLPKISVAMLGFILAATTFALPLRMDQPFMKAALADLKEAQRSLNRAKADKGGHRVNAMDYTAKAITAVENGIEWYRLHPINADTGDLLENVLPEDQPNMVAARKSLNSALDNLNRADPDKGGYRVQAIDFVKNAISEVNAGIEYERTH